jgi:cytosine/adenosine deaminase-related metal-dependent hydrolase
MRLGSGRAPCRHLLGRGIKVAIGIDEAGLNDDRDMLQEMRLVSHLHKDPGVLDKRLGAGDVFRMATEHGAQTTGFAGTIGRIAPGMAADLVLFDWNSITGPYLDAEVPLVDAIVYRAKQRAVRTVMIGGRVVYADGAFTFVDRESALREIHLAMSGPPSETELRRRRTARELMSHLRTFYTTGEWGELSSRLVRNAEAMTFYQPELD